LTTQPSAQPAKTPVLAFIPLPSDQEVADIQTTQATLWRNFEHISGPGEFGSFEPYVDEFVIARFLQIEPRRVLEMVRAGEIPGHPIGRTRKTWRFRLSEIDAHFSTPKKPVRATMATAVPGTPERKHRG
jgi:Helix-turn-helix domain